MSKKRNIPIALALAIFAFILIVITLAGVSYEHSGHTMAPGPVGEPMRKHLV